MAASHVEKVEEHIVGIYLVEQVPVVDKKTGAFGGWHAKSPRETLLSSFNAFLTLDESDRAYIDMNSALKKICELIIFNLSTEVNMPLFRLGQGICVWRREHGEKSLKTANYEQIWSDKFPFSAGQEKLEVYKRYHVTCVI